MRRTALSMIVILSVLVGLPGRSEAQIPVTDTAHIATSVWAEVERYVQAVEDFIVQAEQIYNQYVQIEYQLKALEKLDIHTWRDVSRVFHRMHGLIDGVDGVLYNAEHLEERFFETFPAGATYTNYREDSWRSLFRTMETLRVSLESLQLITADDEYDLLSLSAIEGSIQGAQGHEEVLEGIGNLLSWNAKQTLLAERINAAEANASAVAKAYEINEAARSRETYTAFLEGTVADAVTGVYDGNQPIFRSLPRWMPR